MAQNRFLYEKSEDRPSLVAARMRRAVRRHALHGPVSMLNAWYDFLRNEHHPVVDGVSGFATLLFVVCEFESPFLSFRLSVFLSFVFSLSSRVVRHASFATPTRGGRIVDVDLGYSRLASKAYFEHAVGHSGALVDLHRQAL